MRNWDHDEKIGDKIFRENEFVDDPVEYSRTDFTKLYQPRNARFMLTQYRGRRISDWSKMDSVIFGSFPVVKMKLEHGNITHGTSHQRYQIQVNGQMMSFVPRFTEFIKTRNNVFHRFILTHTNENENKNNRCPVVSIGLNTRGTFVFECIRNDPIRREDQQRDFQQNQHYFYRYYGCETQPERNNMSPDIFFEFDKNIHHWYQIWENGSSTNREARQYDTENEANDDNYQWVFDRDYMHKIYGEIEPGHINDVFLARVSCENQNDINDTFNWFARREYNDKIILEDRGTKSGWIKETMYETNLMKTN